MSKADLSLDGFSGVMEAVVEAAKRFRHYEEQYRSNADAFGRLQQEFQQIRDTATQLHSLSEERLAALSSMNIELKARHAQGEQTLAETQALLVEIKQLQPKLEQSLAAVESRQQVDGGQAAQLAQTVAVLQSLVEQVQARQSQLEQSLVAVETLTKDLGKRATDRAGDWSGVQKLAEHTAERQAQSEKALAIIQSAQQGEKGVKSHFEKSLNTVRSMAVDFDKRLAQIEITVSAIKASGTDATAINLQSVDTARRLIEDLGERQATLQTLIDQIQQTSAQTAEQVAKVNEQVTRLEKTSSQALEEAQAAGTKAANALEKAAQQPAAGSALAVVAVPAENQEQASTDFQGFLQRCYQDHTAAVDRHNQLQAQARAALRDLPALAENAVHKFSDQARARIEQLWTGWLQPREQRVSEMEARFDEISDKAAAMHEALEQVVAAQRQDPTTPPEWAETLHAADAARAAEIKFLKTMVWITLAAVALSYGLVVYAVILRGSAS